MKPRFLKHMEQAFGARKHVILTLNTEDRFFFAEEKIGPANLNYFLAGYFGRHEFRVAQYTPSTGLRELSAVEGAVHDLNGDAIARDTDLFNRIAGYLRDADPSWIVLLQHAERLAPMNAPMSGDQPPYAEMLHSLALDDGIAAGRSRMVLVTFTGMPDDLLVRSRGFELVEVDLPGYGERLDFIQFLKELPCGKEDPPGVQTPEMSSESMARFTAGMPLCGIEALWRSAAASGEPIDHREIRTVKSRSIRNLAQDLLTVEEPCEGFDNVAGLNGCKSYFKQLIPYIHAGDAAVPQAILLQGVPGCGKSHFVTALAGELGWPLLQLRNVRNPYVGQSEINLERIIRVVEQLKPAILFFDEIDQSLGQRGSGVSGDSGTSERLLARIFTWLGSLTHRGKLIFAGATNRPDLLDAALLDRFGVSIPFLKPSVRDLQDLVPLLLKRFERTLKDVGASEVARMLARHALTGRMVQEIIIDAGLAADRDGKGIGLPIGPQNMAQALEGQIAREDELEMEYIGLVALSLAGKHSLLPWNGSGGLRHGEEIPAEFIRNGAVRADGTLDIQGLRKRLEVLRRLRYERRNMR